MKKETKGRVFKTSSKKDLLRSNKRYITNKRDTINRKH